MKLLRATCPCGYRTHKARSGYHNYKWWIPIFRFDDATLIDVLAALPDDQRKRIDNHQIDLYHQTPRDDKTARQEASAQMRAFNDRVRNDFINRATEEYRQQYESDDSCDFNPRIDTLFSCPRCKGQTLKLKLAPVVAYCKTGCEHIYDWQDSEISGCPKCGHRPHRFKTDCETVFQDEPRTMCSCPCSSSTDCVSHLDGYCPKCGELPATYVVDGVNYCGKHHDRLIVYNCPANFLFIETESRWAAHQFPNAKLWGDAESDSDGHLTSYCLSCESDHQDWLAMQAVDG